VAAAAWEAHEAAVLRDGTTNFERIYPEAEPARAAAYERVAQASAECFDRSTGITYDSRRKKEPIAPPAPSPGAPGANGGKAGGSSKNNTPTKPKAKPKADEEARPRDAARLLRSGPPGRERAEPKTQRNAIPLERAPQPEPEPVGLSPRRIQRPSAAPSVEYLRSLRQGSASASPTVLRREAPSPPPASAPSAAAAPRRGACDLEPSYLSVSGGASRSCGGAAFPSRSQLVTRALAGAGAGPRCFVGGWSSGGLSDSSEHFAPALRRPRSGASRSLQVDATLQQLAREQAATYVQAQGYATHALAHQSHQRPLATAAVSAPVSGGGREAPAAAPRDVETVPGDFGLCARRLQPSASCSLLPSGRQAAEPRGLATSAGSNATSGGSNQGTARRAASGAACCCTGRMFGDAPAKRTMLESGSQVQLTTGAEGSSPLSAPAAKSCLAPGPQLQLTTEARRSTECSSPLSAPAAKSCLAPGPVVSRGLGLGCGSGGGLGGGAVGASECSSPLSAPAAKCLAPGVASRGLGLGCGSGGGLGGGAVGASECSSPLSAPAAKSCLAPGPTVASRGLGLGCGASGALGGGAVCGVSCNTADLVVVLAAITARKSGGVSCVPPLPFGASSLAAPALRRAEQAATPGSAGGVGGGVGRGSMGGSGVGGGGVGGGLGGGVGGEVGGSALLVGSGLAVPSPKGSILDWMRERTSLEMRERSSLEPLDRLVTSPVASTLGGRAFRMRRHTPLERAEPQPAPAVGGTSPLCGQAFPMRRRSSSDAVRDAASPRGAASPRCRSGGARSSAVPSAAPSPLRERLAAGEVGGAASPRCRSGGARAAGPSAVPSTPLRERLEVNPSQAAGEVGGRPVQPTPLSGSCGSSPRGGSGRININRLQPRPETQPAHCGASAATSVFTPTAAASFTANVTSSTPTAATSFTTTNALQPSLSRPISRPCATAAVLAHTSGFGTVRRGSKPEFGREDSRSLGPLPVSREDIHSTVSASRPPA